jgi:hypothetical protein
VRCVRCSEDSKKKDRSDGKCPKCGEAFAFDPTAGEPSDMAFQHWIDRVSAKGRVRFTEGQLYYEARRSAVAALPGKRAARTIGLVLLAGLTLALVAATPFVVITGLFAAVSFLALVVVFASEGPKALDPETFAGLFRRWVRAHGPPDALAVRPKPTARPRADAAELDAYSFDRAVITDNADTVDVLIANRFHFENNCAVLSVDGHPRGAFEQIRRMLRNNPRIEVFALHDATVAGCKLAYHLRHDAEWFRDIGRVYDVGLRPEHGPFFEYAVMDTEDRVDPHPALTAAEVAWLSAHTLELAAIRPEQLIKRLYRAMTHQPVFEERPGGDGGDGASTGDITLFGTDADASDGGADSFG